MYQKIITFILSLSVLKCFQVEFNLAANPRPIQQINPLFSLFGKYKINHKYYRRGGFSSTSDDK